jgi:putative tryptophan/tyrosine transport system substrate-binding protein
MSFDPMKRREFITLLGVAVGAWPLLARAEEPALKRWRIGNVLVGTPDVVDRLGAALEQRLAELGYQNGRNINIVTRIVVPQPEVVEREIATLLPDIDVLVVGGTIGGVAAKKVASAVPTVFHSVGAPVDIGLVQSLAHPGGNITGISFEAAVEAHGKRLQLLKEIVPHLSRVAVLRAPGDPNTKIAMAALEQSAPQLGLALSAFDVRSGADLDNAFRDMQRSGMEAVLVVAGSLTYSTGRRIADLALQTHQPSCHAFREAVIAGGLMSLGPDLVEIARQVAIYLDKIMHGAKPADLPVQEPNNFDLYLNLRTAAALGLTIPPTLLATANEVIE